MNKNREEFEKRIGVVFKKKELLEKAFIHRSFINEKEGRGLEHNERIEFLGDAVLELSATEFLYKKYPKETEGVLTSYRSALVNTDSLAKHAIDLKMEEYLMLSKGEKMSTKGRNHIMANTFEAVTGAIYLDQGFLVADTFLKKNLFTYIDMIIEKKLYKDPKSYFQEQAQEIAKVTPEYTLVGHEGPDHDRFFVMAVYIGDEKVAEGKGISKQKAEVDAARNALEAKNWI
jgi:ribonuclease-3